MTFRIATWSLEKIAEAAQGTLRGQGASPSSVSTDTRSIETGALFIPVVGDRFDGHDFISQAIENGAACVFSDREMSIGIPIVLVNDTVEAFQRLAGALFLEAVEEGLTTIALTGSNGKTTTKELIAAIWRAHGYRVHATPGNLNNHIGLPLTLAALELEHEVAVLEMGANDFGDIDELIRIAPATTRMVTSIGAAHLENLGDLDGVRRVKGEIFRADAAASTVAICPLNEAGSLIPRDWPGEVLCVGDDADVEVIQTTARGVGQLVTLRIDELEYEFELPLPGAHNAFNLGLAFATMLANTVEIEPAAVQRGLALLELPDGRMRLAHSGRWAIVDDAYNANPTSARASFAAFAEIVFDAEDVEELDRVAVLGEMLELGADAAEMHASLAADLAAFDAVEAFVFVGPHAGLMRDAAVEARANARAFDDVDAASQWLIERGPALVWLKGSRGARLERITERIEEYESQR